MNKKVIIEDSKIKESELDVCVFLLIWIVYTFLSRRIITNATNSMNNFNNTENIFDYKIKTRTATYIVATKNYANENLTFPEFLKVLIWKNDFTKVNVLFLLLCQVIAFWETDFSTEIHFFVEKKEILTEIPSTCFCCCCCFFIEWWPRISDMTGSSGFCRSRCQFRPMCGRLHEEESVMAF